MKKIIVIVWFLLGLVLLSGQFKRTELKQETKSDQPSSLSEIINIGETKTCFEIGEYPELEYAKINNNSESNRFLKT